MTNPDDEIEPAPEEGTVLKTEGEDSARAYTASALPEGTECPTIEVDRVRLMPPTQTPTVELAVLAKRQGPRAPEQMQRVKAEARGPVELPEGRPVTKMQRIEVDSELLIELARQRAEGRTRTEGEGEAERTAAADIVEVHTAEAHAAETVPGASVSTRDAVVRPARRPVLMGVAIAATAGVVVVAAMRPAKEPAPRAAAPSAMVVPSVTGVPSVTASSAKTAPIPSTAPSAAAVPSERLPQSNRPPIKQRVEEDPHGTVAAPSPPKTAAPVATIAPSAPPATTTATPPAPVNSAPVAPAPEPTIKPVF